MTNIRRAKPEEAATLTQIALEAKRHWGYPEHWIKHWEPDLTITPGFIQQNEVYVAAQQDELCGFYALTLEGKHAELEHMWVLPAYIGTGIGKELFLDAMNRASEMKINQVNITADPHAEGFYQHMGAKNSGEVTSEIDGTSRSIPRLKIEP